MTTYESYDEFLSGPQVQRRYKRSHVCIWRWRHDPKLNFPTPLRINRLLYWRRSDLEDWERDQAIGVA
jgi:predicted DNA-binding transcriptional regulator AlpA